MELKDFIENFASQFEETDASEIKADTEFRALDEWSSLAALSVIAMVDEEYGVTLKGDDMRSTRTVGGGISTVMYDSKKCMKNFFNEEWKSMRNDWIFTCPY